MFLKSNNPSREVTASQTTTTVSSANAKKMTPTIISSDVNILGNFISEGTVDMGGRIDGTLKAAHITIRQNGMVKGDIIGDVVHVYGEVKGIIKARTVALFSSCRVEGVIMHESLTIEDGAFVDGKFKRSDKIAIANDDEDMESFEEITPASSDRNNMKILENLKLVTG